MKRIIFAVWLLGFVVSLVFTSGIRVAAGVSPPVAIGGKVLAAAVWPVVLVMAQKN